MLTMIEPAAGTAPTTRIPATSPISGPFWEVFVPAALLTVAVVATWLLYRRFAKDSDEADGTGNS